MTGTRKYHVIVPVLIALIAVLLVDQTRFLFVYPVPDTGMWFGDESWTMLTVRALARTGVACVPEALGSSLAHSNGLINGSIWISGLIYGLPAAIFSSVGSPVEIGRVITFIVSIVCLISVYRLSRKVGANTVACLVAIFALVLSNAFYFSSHSARLDMLTGLSVLLFMYLLVYVFKRAENNSLNARWTFLLPLLAALSLAIYVHVPTLIIFPLLYSNWKLGVFNSTRKIGIFLSGSVAGVLIIAGIYWLTTGSLDLLGKGYNQYYNVANSLPILHLRSWRVQKINTIDRAIQVWGVAWPLVMAIIAGIAVRLWTKAKFSPIEKFFLINALLVFLSWTLFEGPAVYYNIHAMPVAAVCVAILFSPVFNLGNKRTFEWAMSFVFIAVTILVISYQEQSGAIGKQIVNGNHIAVHSLIDSISNKAKPPLILTDEPGLNEVAGDNRVRLMTNHLLLFGDENKPLADILREKHVDYLLLYSTFQWHSPFRHIADSLYTLVGERTGTLTDQARNYDAPDSFHSDTLRLYKTKANLQHDYVEKN